jgi:VWFA-related protein
MAGLSKKNMRLMFSQIGSKRAVFRCLVASFVALQALAAFGQQPSPESRTAERVDDVISITTDLVQTDIQVFDKSGRLVNGLERDQFDLRIDGKPQKVDFFERVVAGSANEERQLAAARGTTPVAPIRTVAAGPVSHKRVIAFFVDDMHLTPESAERTRKLLQDFVINRKAPGDVVLIASSTGQPGFLQQFTDSKEMLLAAISRLKYQPQSVLDTTNMPMTTYEAMAIERGEWGVINRKVSEAIARYPLARRQRITDIRLMVEQEVRGIARQIVQHASVRDSNVLLTLESLAHSSAAISGRKLVFFISDGFVMDPRVSDVRTKLLRLTDTAARNGVVIYTIDARGLFSAFADASTDVLSMETRSESLLAESVSSQEVLRVLASDTGGRAILNTSKPADRIARAVRETSEYYLLAWRPERVESDKLRLHRIEVSIKDRPDLVVFARKGTNGSDPTATIGRARAKTGKSVAKTPNEELAVALSAPLPSRDLHLSLYPSYTNDALRGSLLTISAQLSGSDYATVSTDKPTTDLTVGCVVLNSEGKSVFTSGRQLSLAARPSDQQAANEKFVIEFGAIEKGLYQIRCAAVDSQSDRIGSAYQWIDIPQFDANHLSLSSLLLSEQKAAAEQVNGTPPSGQDLALNIERRFSRSSRLLCQTYIYNARLGPDGTQQLTVQVKLFSNEAEIAASTPQVLTTTGLKDVVRIPYFVPLPLRSLPAGEYKLQVIVTDQRTNNIASQEKDFTVQ